MNPGETNQRDGEKITGENTESSIPDEGSIYFDIRFFAYYPVNGKKVKIIINIEAQKDFYPGYSIVTRGIFYAARMVSAQLDTEFSVPDYDGIKKVYSVWLCMNAPRYIGNAVSEYHVVKKDIIKGIPDRIREYDKISVIMICLNDKKENENRLTAMLNVLFSDKHKEKEKIDILEKEFDIPMEDGMKKEMKMMCNLSEYVEERGIEKGILQGIQALTETCKELNLTKGDTVTRLQNKFSLSREDAEKSVEKYWK